MEIFNLQLESYLLAGVLRYPHVFPDIDGEVVVNDFKNKLHQTIWRIIGQTLHLGEPLDKVIIAQKIDRLALSFEDKISSVADYLTELSLIDIKEESIKGIAEELKTVSLRRNIAETGEEIVEAMEHNKNLPSDQIVSLSNQIYTKVINNFKPKNEPVDLFKGIHEYIESLDNDRPSDEIICPFPTYQKFFGGYFPGDLTVYCSQPKQGKSTLLANIMKEVCEYKEDNIKGLIVDTELETYRVQRRIISAISGVNEYLIKSKRWRRQKGLVDRIEKAVAEMESYFSKIDHIYVGNIPTEEMVSIIRRWHWKNVDKKTNKAIVAIDYFKLTGADNVEEAFAASMKLGYRVDTLKKLASELQIPILGACQLNRAGQIGLSHEVSKFCSSIFQFERKTKEELQRDNGTIEDTGTNSTHKLVPLYTRDLGEYTEGVNDLVKYMDNGKERWAENYINFRVHNFTVAEGGDLKSTLSGFRAHEKMDIRKNVKGVELI